MAVTLIFYEKPKTASKQRAIELVSDIPYFYKDGKYIIKSEYLTPQFKKAVLLAGNWKTTELIINEKEIDIKEFQRIASCFNGRFCNGICHLFFGRIYNEISHAIKWGGDLDYIMDSIKNCPFIVHIENDKYRFDREVFNQYFSDASDLLQFCDYFNEESTLEKFNEIPEHFKISPHAINDDYFGDADDYEEDSDDDESNKIKNHDTSNLAIDYCINNSIIFACTTKKSQDNIIFKIKPLSFEPVELSQIDNQDKIEDFEENGFLYLLKCEIINLSKSEISFYDIKRTLVMADEDDYIYTIYYDYQLYNHTKFSEKTGLNKTEETHFRPKMKKTVILPVFLPDDENQKYYLAVMDGKIKEV